MAEGFTFTKVVVIQSLEPHETKTGEMIADFLTNQIALEGHPTTVELKTCLSANEFVQILADLQREALDGDGEVPILHVETHGSKLSGLEFENGSELSWEDLATHLRALNVATRFNLLALFSACWGGYFLGKMSALQQAPCYAMVAPSEELWPNEIYAGFTAFYRVFLRTLDVAPAVNVLAATKLEEGYWFGHPAEIWFERLILDYVRTKCTNEMSTRRARILQADLALEGKICEISQLLEVMRTRNRNSLLHDYFRNYFMLEMIPENADRFAGTLKRMKNVLDHLSVAGQHVI